MQGSTLTWVLLSMVIVGRLSSLNPGFVNRRIVWDGVHELADDAARGQSVSMISEVSSKTFTLTISSCFPFFVVTESASLAQNHV